MPKPKKLDPIALHQKARKDFDEIQKALRNEREQCLEDRRFYSIAGAMWEGDLGKQFKNKPKFEINKIHLSIIKIINEYRNNRITVSFVPRNGEKNDILSDNVNGLYRSDETDSSAEEAYDNAFEEAVGGGIGAFRLRTQYEDEYDDDNEEQRIRIEPIYDADTSVYFDLNSKKQDKSDAKYCFVITSLTTESFIEQYGKVPATWPKDGTRTSYFDWETPDIIYLAEYYKVEEVNETVQVYKDLNDEEVVYSDEDFENDEDLAKTLQATGTFKVKDKKVKRKKIHKYIMSGEKILEDLGYIPGGNIPIVPVFGKRWFIDNVERAMGHVRLAKDSARLKNMQTSKLAEASALASVEKPIVTPQQITNHQLMWQDDNIKNWPYLLLNPIIDKDGVQMPAGPIGYTKVPQVAPAMAALLQITETDMKEILGNQQQNEDIPNNVSGKAVELIQNKIDMQTFIYMSNMAKAIKRGGEIWLGIAQEVYIEEGRKMKTVGSQQEISSVELSQPMMNEETGEIEHQNDIANAKMGVTVTVGPSSDSKRAATVRSLTGMMAIAQQDPDTLNVLTSMAMMNMEGEGVEDAREYFRQRLIKIGAVKPTKEEAAKLQKEAENQPPDANAEYLKAAALEAEAKAKKTEADTVLTITKVDETKAKTLETLSNISNNGKEKAINDLRSLDTIASKNQAQA